MQISHLRKTFQREFDERYTGEIFRVKSRLKRAGLNVYTLEDLQNEQVEGDFYDSELQQVTVDYDGLFKVEKGGVAKKIPHKMERYYPDKFNSWVGASNVQDV